MNANDNVATAKIKINECNSCVNESIGSDTTHSGINKFTNHHILRPPPGFDEIPLHKNEIPYVNDIFTYYNNYMQTSMQFNPVYNRGIQQYMQCMNFPNTNTSFHSTSFQNDILNGRVFFPNSTFCYSAPNFIQNWQNSYVHNNTEHNSQTFANYGNGYDPQQCLSNNNNRINPHANQYNQSENKNPTAGIPIFEQLSPHSLNPTINNEVNTNVKFTQARQLLNPASGFEGITSQNVDYQIQQHGADLKPTENVCRYTDLNPTKYDIPPTDDLLKVQKDWIFELEDNSLFQRSPDLIHAKDDNNVLLNEELVKNSEFAGNCDEFCKGESYHSQTNFHNNDIAVTFVPAESVTEEIVKCNEENTYLDFQNTSCPDENIPTVQNNSLLEQEIENDHIDELCDNRNSQVNKNNLNDVESIECPNKCFEEKLVTDENYCCQSDVNVINTELITNSSHNKVDDVKLDEKETSCTIQSNNNDKMVKNISNHQNNITKLGEEKTCSDMPQFFGDILLNSSIDSSSNDFNSEGISETCSDQGVNSLPEYVDQDDNYLESDILNDTKQNVTCKDWDISSSSSCLSSSSDVGIHNLVTEHRNSLNDKKQCITDVGKKCSWNNYESDKNSFSDCTTPSETPNLHCKFENTNQIGIDVDLNVDNLNEVHDEKTSDFSRCAEKDEQENNFKYVKMFGKSHLCLCVSLLIDKNHLISRIVNN